ncbi:SPOR domain-containing protein [Gallaecimonas mangrovi]|uniref:SPOR domain-containing protein n=1 Tax=Gallaecimonas mangrovi TaxID=2291597 RepID=UPI000E1FC0A8|nr:SPOR domain-containing protein [Gallaecimonas mangrovi]
MARKDYVKTTAPKRRTNNKKNAPQRKPPWLAIAVFAVCALGFIYFLATLPKSSDKPKEEPVAVKPKAQEAPSQHKKPLPAPPKEQWRYVETLKNKTVEVDVPDRPKDETPYQMQCGSFKLEKQAEAQKAKLAFVGMEAQVRHTGDWYRVVLGPYAGRRAAQNDQHKAESKGFPHCAIWPWR